MVTATRIAGDFMSFMPLLITLAWVAASMVYGVRRLNDMDRTGWWALLLFVPVVNLGVGLYLLFGPGSKEANSYGLPPGRNGAGMIVLCCVMVLTGAFFALAGFGIAKIVELSNPRNPGWSGT